MDPGQRTAVFLNYLTCILVTELYLKEYLDVVRFLMYSFLFNVCGPVSTTQTQVFVP